MQSVVADNNRQPVDIVWSIANRFAARGGDPIVVDSSHPVLVVRNG